MSEKYFRVPLYVTLESSKLLAGKPKLLMKLRNSLTQLTCLDMNEEADNDFGVIALDINWDELTPIDKLSGVCPPEHGQRIRLTLRDKNGNLVESQNLDANAAGDLARKFVVLQGSDPEEKGRGATSGSIEFEPL